MKNLPTEIDIVNILNNLVLTEKLQPKSLIP